MKSIEELKENPKLELLRIGIDGGTGILHITGLRKCTVIWRLAVAGNMYPFVRQTDFQHGAKCVW